MCFFFFNDTATTEIYTLSLHDALPIYAPQLVVAEAVAAVEVADAVDAPVGRRQPDRLALGGPGGAVTGTDRSEEHTSELQSRQYLVCRLLLEKKKKQ